MFDLRFKMSESGGCESSRCAPHPSKILNLKSNIHPGLTLIELLVVIIILTTLVAGVIPILSPNNDSRKIREATRGLQTYITMAQAEAARSGRSQGIAFQETSLGSGVALEVFRLEVPPPFAGFSSSSSAIFRDLTPLDQNTYVFEIQLGEGLGSSFIAGTGLDVPARFTRPGDIIDFGGVQFRLDSDAGVTTINGVEYFDAKSIYFNAELINSSRDSLVFSYPFSHNGNFWTTPRSYKIIRQPTNSAEAPYQLPASIAIDFQGSVAEGSSVPTMPRFPTTVSLFQNTINKAVSVPIVPDNTPNTVGIMFSPTGGVSSVYLNGNTLTNVSRLVLLLGRVENGGLADGDWAMAAGYTSEQIKEKQDVINWLNLDSRWLSIAANSGRAVVTENAFISPSALADPTSAEDQIEAAHEFAHEMKTGGGG